MSSGGQRHDILRRDSIRGYTSVHTAPFVPPALPLAGMFERWIADILTMSVSTLKVAAWTGQINGRVWAQGVDGQRPLYTASVPALTGKPAVSFTGAQIMTTTLAMPAFPAGISFVFAIANTPSAGAIIVETGSSASADFAGVYVDGGPRYRVLYQKPVGSWHQNGFTPAPTASCFIATIDPVTPAVVTYVDNVAGGALSAAATAGTVAAGTWCLGARPALTAPLTGDIAEIVIYDHVLSASERLAVTNYMQTTYG